MELKKDLKDGTNKMALQKIREAHRAHYIRHVTTLYICATHVRAHVRAREGLFSKLKTTNLDVKSGWIGLRAQIAISKSNAVRKSNIKNWNYGLSKIRKNFPKIGFRLRRRAENLKHSEFKGNKNSLFLCLFQINTTRYCVLFEKWKKSKKI